MLGAVVRKIRIYLTEVDRNECLLGVHFARMVVSLEDLLPFKVGLSEESCWQSLGCR